MYKKMLVCAVVGLIGITATMMISGCTAITSYLGVSSDSKVQQVIAAALVKAYNEGGAAKFSEAIDQCVANGDLTEKQAAKIKELAQTIYEKFVAKLTAAQTTTADATVEAAADTTADETARSLNLEAITE